MEDVLVGSVLVFGCGKIIIIFYYVKVFLLYWVYIFGFINLLFYIEKFLSLFERL